MYKCIHIYFFLLFLSPQSVYRKNCQDINNSFTTHQIDKIFTTICISHHFKRRKLQYNIKKNLNE